MNKDELNKEKNMSYDELVKYLQLKYGKSQYYYFTKNTFKSKNPKVTRTSEGLLCHHVGENKHIMLSNPKFASKWSYEEFQSPDALVYCNYLEHLLLHIKICSETNISDTKLELPGIGGVINFIIPELNSYFTNPPTSTWRKNVFDIISENYDDYLQIICENCDALINKYKNIIIMHNGQEIKNLDSFSYSNVLDPNYNGNIIPKIKKDLEITYKKIKV